MDELSSISRKKCVDCHAKFAAIAAAGQQQAFDVMTTPTGLGWERTFVSGLTYCSVIPVTDVERRYS
jgi:hypothetical protein